MRGRYVSNPGNGSISVFNVRVAVQGGSPL